MTRPWKLDPAACTHPEHSIQKGGNAKMYYERCRDCGSRWQRKTIAITSSPVPLDNNRTCHTPAGQKTVETSAKIIRTSAWTAEQFASSTGWTLTTSTPSGPRQTPTARPGKCPCGARFLLGPKKRFLNARPCQKQFSKN